MDDRSFNLLSLCMGGRGLDRGVELAVPGARTVCGVEWDAFACEVVAREMEAAGGQGCPVAAFPVWSGVRTFDGRPWRGLVDCVVAGIPCQGNSLAGKRLLSDDPRDLWPDTRRILREVEPGWFLLENVYGFVVPGDGRCAPAARVLGELAEDGWDAEWLVLPASAVGAPHRRERFFLLARNNAVAHRAGGGIGERGQSPGRDGFTDGCHGVVADAPRHDGGGCDGQGGRGRGVCGERGNVGHAQRAQSRPREPGEQGYAELGRGGLADAGHAGVGLADPGIEGREGHERREPHGPQHGLDAPGPVAELRGARLHPHDRPLWPPGPHERERWATVAPEAQPAVCRLPDGLAATRREWLRVLGNGVVPLQAAVAFHVLRSRFED